MVYQRISCDRKERTLYLLLEEGWDIDRIAVALGVSSRSIERWEAHYDEHGHINPSTPIMGRPRLLDQVMTDEIHELLAETPSLLLDEIGEWLAIYHDQPISTTALHENLRDLGLTYKRLRRVAAERDDGFRADWLHNMTTNYTAEQLVFLDESSKDDRTILPRYGWSLSGQTPFDSVRLNRGIRYSVLPALTIDGYMAVRVVEGSIDGAEFYDFVLNDVLPSMNPFPGPNSVIVLDNCSTHKSDALREAVEASGCLLIFLPPYSPDFNPIEESFSCLKKWFRRHWRDLRHSQFPEQDLREACFRAINAENARGWYMHIGYL